MNMNMNMNMNMRAEKDLMNVLRYNAQISRMVTKLGNSSGRNSETALDYVNVNLRHHRFQEAHGHQVRQQYDGLADILHRHSEHRKATVLRTLCSQLCSSRGSEGDAAAAWEWIAAHGYLQQGLQAMALLYWLSNTPQMVHAPMPTVDGSRSPSSREQVDEVIAAKWEPPALWGFSDAEEEEEVVVEGEGTGAVSEAAASEAAAQEGAGPQPGARSSEGIAAWGTGPRLSRPPAWLDLGLLAPALLRALPGGSPDEAKKAGASHCHPLQAELRTVRISRSSPSAVHWLLITPHPRRARRCGRWRAW